jgi:putative DNA primase/helicase
MLTLINVSDDVARQDAFWVAMGQYFFWDAETSSLVEAYIAEGRVPSGEATEPEPAVASAAAEADGPERCPGCDERMEEIAGGRPHRPGCRGPDAALIPPAPPAAAAPPVIDEGPYTLTDDGNALRLIDERGETLRYVSERGKWLIWDGYYWRWDESDETVQLVREMGRLFPTTSARQMAWQRHTLSKQGIAACLGVACADPRVRVAADRLDAHSLELNTPDGIIDLETGEIRPPDPQQMHTQSTSIGPDFDMPTPRFDAFMNDTFGGDDLMVEFMLRLMGYSASGDTRFHVLPFLHGPGQNGKSQLVELLTLMLGDYAMAAGEGFLVANHNDHPTVLAKLKGRRFVMGAEVNQGDRFNEARMKQLTGGDMVTARFMHKDEFTFRPTHHLWLMGNHQPQVAAGGDSFWRRMRLIPFAHRVPDELKIDRLAEIMYAEEGPGILAKVILGAVDAFAHGLQEPQSVMAATGEYADEEDHLTRFLEEAVKLGGGLSQRLRTSDLRSSYVKWCGEEGIKGAQMSPQALGRELKQRGVMSDRSNGKRYYLGMTLIDASPAMFPGYQRGAGYGSPN